MNHNYYVYILLCANGKYYVGVTNNIERRFAEHQEGVNPFSYTYQVRPVELVLVEWFHDIRQAIDREKQLKGWSAPKKKALTAGDEKLLSFHALAYERRTFPPLTPEQRRKLTSGSAGSP